MTLPTPIADDLAQATLDSESWRLPPKPSTSVTIEPPPTHPHANELELVDNSIPGTARETNAVIEDLKAFIAQAVRPRRWLSGWRTAGNDYPLPEYAKWAMFVIPASISAASTVRIGSVLHTLPVGPSTVTIPTLRAPQISWPGGASEIQYACGSDPEDVLMLREVAI